MRHRKQYPEDLGKQLCEQTHEVPSAISFAFLSVKLPEAKGTNILARLATAAWSLYEQHDLWKRTELFFQRHMGCLGRVIKVHGDLQPPASYLIMAPGVQLFPDVLEAAREFVTACTSFKSLEVQLQIGRSAVVNNTGTCRVALSPFFNARWRQHCNGLECVQFFAELTSKRIAAHALISRADFSAEAKLLSLQYGSDLTQLLAQVQADSSADAKFPLQHCTAGCSMLVPNDGRVFMVLLTVPAGDTFLYNLLT